MSAMDEREIEQEVQDRGLTAPRISPDDLDAKIVDCRYRIQIADANRLAAAKKWAEAEAAYQKAKEIKPEARGIVLAHGEVTGHAHRIAVPKREECKVRYWDAGAERYLQVLEKVTLEHEEHGAIDLPAGSYLVR